MIRDQYSELGIEGYYLEKGDTYQNPHASRVVAHIDLLLERGYWLTNVLDLCCGNGLVTRTLEERGYCRTVGCDPFLYRQYVWRTECPCLKYDFKDIAKGKLSGKYNFIICSYGLHLCERSLLPFVFYQLARISAFLIVISPNKRPETIDYFSVCEQFSYRRTHTRVLRSLLFDGD